MQNILYINPLHTDIVFLIQSPDINIRKTLIKNLETSSTFPKILFEIIEEFQIHEIWCITGPGPFTLMRIITLAINAMVYTRNIRVKSVHFFDLIDQRNTPMIESNPREYLIKQNHELIYIKKELIGSGDYEGIFGEVTSTEDIKFIEYKEDWDNITHIFSTKSPEHRIYPIYFKPPHITCPKA